MDDDDVKLGAYIWGLFPADAGNKAPLLDVLEDESSVPGEVLAEANWWREHVRKAATHMARFDYGGRVLNLLDITTLGDERYAEVVNDAGVVVCAVAAPIYRNGHLQLPPGPCSSAALRAAVLLDG